MIDFGAGRPAASGKPGRMMRALLTAVGLALLLSTSATAAPQEANRDLAADARIVDRVTIEDLKAVVLASGNVIDELKAEGDVSVKGRTPEGLVFLLIGTACKLNACQGIMMQVRYDTNESVTLQRVAKASLEQAAVSVWFNQDTDTLGITRYVVLDHGVTMANVKENLNVLMAITPMVVATVFPD